MRFVKLLALVLLMAAVTPMWADDTPSPSPAPQRSLYERLGGEKTLKAVIDDFYDRVQADGEMRSLFIGQDLNHIKKRTTDYLGQAIGGPQVYTGRDVHASHLRMHITQDQWARTMGFLKESMAKCEVPQQEQDDLYAVIQSAKTEIVQGEDRGPTDF